MDINDGKINSKSKIGYFAEGGVGITEENFGAAERVKDPEKASKNLLSEVFFGLLFGFFGYVLGLAVLPYGAMPLGIAFLCATDRKAWYIYLGLCLSALGNPHMVIYLVAYTAAVFIRLLIKLTLDLPIAEDGKPAKSLAAVAPEFFKEHIYLRMSTACVAAFIVGIYKLSAGGFLYYDLYGAIISLIAAPALVLLVSGQFGFVRKESLFADFSFALITVGLVYFSADFFLFGISVSAFGAMFVTLFLCRKRGILYGMAIGTLAGLVYSPLLAPVFGVGALIFGILSGLSVFFAAAAVFTVGMGWAFYAKGISALTGLAPALLAACMLYSVADKLFIAENLKSKEAVVTKKEKTYRCDKLDAREIQAIRLRDMNLLVNATHDTLLGLSEMFFDVSERGKSPDGGDLLHLCRSAFDIKCVGCDFRGECREKPETEKELSNIAAALKAGGKVTLGEVSRGLRTRCEGISEIIEEINYHNSLRIQQIMQSDKTEIFALEYAAMAELFRENMTLDDSEYEENKSLTDKICTALRKSDFEVGGVIAYGSRERRIILRSYGKGNFPDREGIIAKVSEVCPFSVEFSHLHKGEGYCDLVLKSGAEIKFELAKRSVSAEGEGDFCGDTTCIFENEKGLFYSFLSDGMGSGQDAAFTSGICATFLQRMLSAGNKCEISLKLLNGFLRNKGTGSINECSATVDLMELDLLLSKVAFYKSGAAPTYILREGNLFKLRSKTVPLGIIKELDAKKICFDVGVGDVIIMVSDGVTQGKDECPWLFELIKNNIDKGIETAADLIVETAKKECCSDDISVIVIKIQDI